MRLSTGWVVALVVLPLGPAWTQQVVPIDDCHSRTQTLGQLESTWELDDAPTDPPGRADERVLSSGMLLRLLPRAGAHDSSAIIRQTDGSSYGGAAVQGERAEAVGRVNDTASRTIVRTNLDPRLDCCHSAGARIAISMEARASGSSFADADADQLMVEFGGAGEFSFRSEIRLTTDQCGTPLDMIRRVTFDIDVNWDAEPSGAGGFRFAEVASGTVLTELVINGAIVVFDAAPVSADPGSGFTRRETNEIPLTEVPFDFSVRLGWVTAVGVGAGSNSADDRLFVIAIASNRAGPPLLRETE